MNILLVEDHPIFRFGVRHLVLQRWPDAIVGEADSLQSALSTVNTRVWDVAVVDLNLPDTQGIESVIQIHRAAPALRLLVLSMHDELAYAKQVLRSGAQGYLAKEHATGELIAAIERLEKGGRYISSSMAEHMAQNMLDGSELAAHEQLGKQEYRVMLQIAAGTRVTDIASTMHLSPKTVSTYRTRIFEKLGVSSNVELAQYCMTHHLSDLSL
ncbi:response regulator transcription factor [Rhodoferax sp. 4810]|nr:response regulator transcription factor [Rhodoferax jenense]